MNKLLALSKLAEKVTAKEKLHYSEGYLGPGVPAKHRSELPTVEEPELWEFSAHPHIAMRAGLHIDMRLGNPKTGIAHSFVLSGVDNMPGPGESKKIIPTFDHEIPYMDYTGPISTLYGFGTVFKGRREKADVYHAKPGSDKGTKARFNLYEGAQPEEFSIRTDGKGGWFLHNKTQTRVKRLDIPAEKPIYKEVEINRIDPKDKTQVMMPKLDGASVIVDLKAGRSPRVFSHRVAKKAKTGLIEHTHKIPGMLKTKVPKELDNTMLRAEVVGIRDGKAIAAEETGGFLNAKVLESRAKQDKTGTELHVFPFNVVRHRGKDMSEVPFSEKVGILEKVQKSLSGYTIPRMVFNALEKIGLLNAIKSKKYPLTDEGVVLVNKDGPTRPIKAVITPDFDVYIQGVIPAVSGKTGEKLDRAGAVSYSWTPDGPVVGTLGGFKHEEGRDMLKNSDKYIGRVAKVKARKVFKKGEELGAMFQPRFKEWHLDKGDIEKLAFFDELSKIMEV